MKLSCAIGDGLYPHPQWRRVASLWESYYPIADLDAAPERLAALFGAWSKAPSQMYRASPSLVFAVLGQARADGGLSPEDESELLAKLLTFWAMRSTLDSSAYCAAIPRSRVRALAS